ncbi:aspartate/glutamate racemase family protein [Alteromonas sp. ASW11-130]|uniref:aspartate/glutamate racemase family protein n=1 Tax=Alteromonas sp. ASW11-130 TaxID=3015775 RepID=UPI002241E33D|nr:aspartate/glutamate racemase family protein [Alteromonas sp. ASW11-130]MCW8090947.1 aspartate/glutamate racemase family protein [Alteromonas sp. ASW11-130]
MKTIGLIGGMSWESTASYYRLINTLVKQKLGGLHSAQIVVVSVDFAVIESCQQKGDWEKAGGLLAKAAQQIQAAGADFLILCTNTMHCVSAAIEDAVSIPMLHIADATGIKLKKQGLTTVGLLGTAFTMQQPFYKDRLKNQFGLDVLIPNARDQELVHRVIFNELCQGKFNNQSKQSYLRILEQLHQEGAEGIILGCTEIGLLIEQEDTEVPLFDTAQLHAEFAVDEALKKV